MWNKFNSIRFDSKAANIHMRTHSHQTIKTVDFDLLFHFVHSSLIFRTETNKKETFWQSKMNFSLLPWGRAPQKSKWSMHENKNESFWYAVFSLARCNKWNLSIDWNAVGSYETDHFRFRVEKRAEISMKVREMKRTSQAKQNKTMKYYWHCLHLKRCCAHTIPTDFNGQQMYFA